MAPSIELFLPVYNRRSHQHREWVPATVFFWQGEAIAGRRIPGIAFTVNIDPTNMAPVFPAEAKESIFPSFRRWKPTVILEFCFCWKSFCRMIRHGNDFRSMDDIKTSARNIFPCRIGNIASLSPMSTRRTSDGSSFEHEWHPEQFAPEQNRHP